MSVDFNKILTTEQRVAILENSIQQFAAEGYKHSLNKQVGEDRQDEQLVEESQRAVDTISTAIKTYQEELKKLQK